ncbi:MAG TPA: GtrA family protein [Candidatus Saccharimonadales bacterium]|nr:GtrA family protein [Candidatus Saccharimonadales bacterium]
MSTNSASTTKNSNNPAGRHKLVVQFLEYMVGGGVWFWSGYGIFAICYSGFGWNWLWAKMLADAVGWTLNFLIQRYWAFNDPRLAHKGIRVSKRYAAITALNFVLDYLLIWGLKSIGITPYIAFFISAALFTAWNYLWYKLWVFNPKSS